ncbi:MAG: DUF4123 domain-containing protein [Ginsengibacter sp.]
MLLKNINHLIVNYVILDAARILHDLKTAQELQKNFINLYQDQAELLDCVAPYLFSYQSNSEFEGWLSEKVWGTTGGIFIATQFSMEEIYKHFQKFLFVKTEDGQQFYFRFYDPRVLRIFLPTCEEQQLKEFFGPVQKFICEDEDSAFALLFSFDGKQLLTERVAAETVFSSTKQIYVDEALAATNNDPIREERKPPRRFF